MSFYADEARESMDMFPQQGTQGLKNVIEKADNPMEENKEGGIGHGLQEEEKNENIGEEGNGKIWDEGEEEGPIQDDQSDVSFHELNTTANMIGLEEEYDFFPQSKPLGRRELESWSKETRMRRNSRTKSITPQT